MFATERCPQLTPPFTPFPYIGLPTSTDARVVATTQRLSQSAKMLIITDGLQQSFIDLRSSRARSKLMMLFFIKILLLVPSFFRPFFTIFPSFTSLHISTRNKKNQSGKPSTQSLVLLLRVSEGLMSDGCRHHRSFRACLNLLLSHLFPLLQIDEQQNKKLPQKHS